MATECLKVETITRSPAETHALGHQLGEAIETGIVLALTGDLGSGKTAFAQGLASGLHVPSEYYITSPTYTIINEYPGRMPFYHIDLYRLTDAESVEDIGLFDILQSANTVAIEWPEIIASALPGDRIAIHFKIQDDETRKITIRTYGLQGQNVIVRLDICSPKEQSNEDCNERGT